MSHISLVVRHSTSVLFTMWYIFFTYSIGGIWFYLLQYIFFLLNVQIIYDIIFLSMKKRQNITQGESKCHRISLNQVKLNNESEIRDYRTRCFGAVRGEKQINRAELCLKIPVSLWSQRGTRLTALLSASSLTTDQRGSERISSLEMSKVSQWINSNHQVPTS